MSKSLMKAVETIKRYCEKTQCARCIFRKHGEKHGYYWECKLQEIIPCDWEIDKEEE